jgi:hypothetical protein
MCFILSENAGLLIKLGQKLCFQGVNETRSKSRLIRRDYRKYSSSTIKGLERKVKGTVSPD